MSSYIYNGQLFTVNAPVDLAKNELRNAVIQNLGTAPGTPNIGQVYVDTSVSTDYSLKVYSKATNVNQWVSLMSNPMTTAGDLILGGASGLPTRLATSTSGYVLTSQGPGVAPIWAAASAGFADPMTTIGDIIIRNASNNTVRLGGNTTTAVQVLTSVGTGSAAQAPSWTAAQVTIGSTAIALGTTSTTLAGLTSVTSTSFTGALTGNASTATSVAGGAANQILYQTGAGTTSFITTANYGVVTTGATGTPVVTAGAAGVLVGSASAIPTWSTAPALTGTNFSGIPASAVSGVILQAGSSNFTGGTTNVNSGATLNVASGGFLTVASGATFTYAGTPTNPNDVTNKAYVDNIAVGLTDWKESVRVATTANVTLAGSAPNVVDGVTLAANDRILVKNQTSSAENGIYYVSTLGTGSNGTWTRSTDANTSADVTSGLYVYVSEGTSTNKGQYVLSTANPITLGTTGLTFVRFNGGSALTQGTGITITGDTISLTNQITAGGPTGAAGTVPVITYNAQGQLTAVTTAAITLAGIGYTTSGSGTVLALATSPVFTTPSLGAATATSINGLTITTTTGTLTLANGSTITTSGAFNSTFTATASVSHTLPGEASKLAFIAAATTPAANQIAYFDSTTARLANLTVNSTATKQFLSQTSSGVPTWAALTMADLNVAATGTLTVTRKYTTTITGAGPSFTITHNLNTKDITVLLYDASDNQYFADVTATTVNTATVTFGTNVPGASTHRVVVIG
jgi:hypothetical protein